MFKDKRRKTQYKNRGVALIMAVVIMAVLIVFTFTLALIAYSMYASQNKSIAARKCAESANSLCNALVDELMYTDEVNNRYPEYESYLYKYLRYNICQESTWPSYNEVSDNRGDACRYFDLKYNSDKNVYDDSEAGSGGESLEGDGTNNNSETAKKVDSITGMPGRTYVCIYWRLPDGYSRDTLPGYYETSLRSGIHLFIEVTSVSGDQTYTVTRELVLTIVQYNQMDPYEINRMNYLKDQAANEMINPLQLSTETDVNTSELWIWDLPTSD